MKRSMITQLLILGLLQYGWSQEVLIGEATNVYDGDTFTLITASDEIRIRILGIDAPEMNQDYGVEARDYARDMIEGKKVTVYLEPGETYGRKLGHVITEDGKHFSYEMVLAGFAWWYERYSSDKFLKAAQESARTNRSGLWSNSNAVAPWDFRR